MKQEALSDQVVQSVLNAVDHDELIELTSDLVRINSVWDPVAGTSEEAAAMHVAGWARQRGFEVRVDQVAPGRPNVIVDMVLGRGDRRLMFEGHTDVVTPGDIAAWNHHPFGAEIVGNRMFGRGTNDTKGNLAAMLTAMHALKKSGVQLNGSVVGGVLCDEEDEMIGVLDFIKRGRADGITAAVICEPQDGMICTSQKGALRARFSIQGHMSHGAIPLSGLNTAPAIARLIDGLHRIEMEAVSHQGRDPYLGWPSFTPTVVQAPSAGPPQLNVMPGKAHVLVDIRTIPGQSHETIRSSLKALASEVEAKMADHYKAYDRIVAVRRDHRIRLDVAYLTDRPCTPRDRCPP
jgi:succinyl-diaminopimelate desuccinylase